METIKVDESVHIFSQQLNFAVNLDTHFRCVTGTVLSASGVWSS